MDDPQAPQWHVRAVRGISGKAYLTMERVMALGGHFSYPGLFSLILLGCLGLPIPEDAILLVCGFLIASGTIQTVPTLLVLYAGLIVGDLMIYYIGRRYGRMILTHRWLSRFITPARLERLESRFNHHGIWVILIGRHLVGLRAQIFLAAGVLKMSAPKFLTADAISSIVTIAVMVTLGYLGGYHLQRTVKDIKTVEHVILAVAVVATTAYLLFKLFSRKRKPS